MTTDDEITRELDALIDEVPELNELVKQDQDMAEFGFRYQVWYSRATKIVELLGAERLEEFCSYYRVNPKRKVFNNSTYVIQDYINGVGATKRGIQSLWDTHVTTDVRVINQSQILKALKTRIGTVLTDVTGHLLANIEDEGKLTCFRCHCRRYLGKPSSKGCFKSQNHHQEEESGNIRS
jgi:hypothetical protein